MGKQVAHPTGLQECLPEIAGDHSKRIGLPPYPYGGSPGQLGFDNGDGYSGFHLRVLAGLGAFVEGFERASDGMKPLGVYPGVERLVKWAGIFDTCLFDYRSYHERARFLYISEGSKGARLFEGVSMDRNADFGEPMFRGERPRIVEIDQGWWALGR